MGALIVLHIQVALTVLLVSFLRKCMSGLPKRWSYGLWIIVFLRLLIPVSVESPLGILPGETTLEHIWSRDAGERRGRLDRTFSDGMGLSPEQESGNGISAGEPQPLPEGVLGEQEGFPYMARQPLDAVPASGAREYSWPVIAFGTVWLAGLAAMLGYNFYALLWMRGRLKGAVWLEEELYSCAGIESSFVMGILRPRIYLPAGLDPKTRDYIICHERVHVRRRDYLVKAVAFLLTAFYWYNPFVWVAFCMLEQDMEMSCDEAVVRNLGNGIRRAYSQSLLDHAAGRVGIPAAPPAFGEQSVRQRVKNILTGKRNRWWNTLAGICILALVALLAFTARKGEDGDGHRETAGAQQVERQTEDLAVRPSEEDMAAHSVEAQSELPDHRPGDQVRELPWECYEQIYGGNGIYYLNTRYGIYREEAGPEGDVYTCLYPRYIGAPQPSSLYPRLTLHPNLEKLFFVTDSEYTEDSLDWWDDCVMSLDLRTLETETVARDEGENPPQIWFDRIDALYGIRPAQKAKSSEWEDMVAAWADRGGDLLGQYELVRSLETDVADSSGNETIEVYALREDSELTSMYGGVTRVLDARGNLLLTEVANLPMMGHNALYVGNRDGQDFLMNFYLEDRGTYGVYSYEVYRMTANGEIEQIEGSEFHWDYDERLGEDALLYNDGVFRDWAQQMQGYMEASQLLMSTLEWELETDPTVRPYRYNYDSLTRGHAGEGLKGRE